MSIYYSSELESQVNQYFKSQNTMALADSTKALYNTVLKKNCYLFARKMVLPNSTETSQTIWIVLVSSSSTKKCQLIRLNRI